MSRLIAALVSDRVVLAAIVLNTDELERKVDELTAEVRALRRELRKNS